MIDQPPLNPEALEVAAEAIRMGDYHGVPDVEMDDMVAHLAVSAYLKAARPRTVETVEERESLPVGTIFKDSRGLAAVKSVTGYLIAGYSGEFRALNLPARVLWVPTEGGGDAT